MLPWFLLLITYTNSHRIIFLLYFYDAIFYYGIHSRSVYLSVSQMKILTKI